jgi:hypothetical protein
VALTLPAERRGGHWFYELNGALHADFADSSSVMGVSLPDNIRLQSMRLIGRFSATPPTTFTFTLGRASVTDVDQPPDTVVETTTDRPGMGNPFDVTVPVTDDELGLVDQTNFRYFFRVTAQNPDRGTSLHAVRLGYINL